MLTNESMSADTTKSTKLTDLKNRNGESLNIHKTDKVTVSYVKQGQTYTTTMSVGSLDLGTILGKKAFNGTNELVNALEIKDASNGTAVIGKDGSGNTVYTADMGSAITLTAKTSGTDGQISGLIEIGRASCRERV